MFRETEDAWFESRRERAKDHADRGGLWCRKCGEKAVEPDFICDECKDDKPKRRASWVN